MDLMPSWKKTKMRHNFIEMSEFYFVWGGDRCIETTLAVHLSKGNSIEDSVGEILCDASPAGTNSSCSRIRYQSQKPAILN